MNIFFLDRDINKSVQFLVDKHVVKMPLETAQLLCSAIILNKGIAPYKVTHIKHPCTIWTANSINNFEWLREYGIELCKEYTYRYNKIHKCESVIRSLIPTNFNSFTLCDPPQCMPDVYKEQDTVNAYRNYYKKEKFNLFKWTNRSIPYWL